VVAVDEALRLAWDEPGLSQAEVLALGLLQTLRNERRAPAPIARDAGAAGAAADGVAIPGAVVAGAADDGAAIPGVVTADAADDVVAFGGVGTAGAADEVVADDGVVIAGAADDGVVIDLRDRVTERPPPLPSRFGPAVPLLAPPSARQREAQAEPGSAQERDSVWEYDPPAWLDPRRVQPLPVRDVLPSGGSSRSSRDHHALIDWKGTTGSSRFGLSSVRLPFGAIFAEDYEHLDRLRDPAAD
jgi:hypothetical protein